MRLALLAMTGLLLLAGMGSPGALAQAGGSEWVSLGCKAVGFNVDRDVIPVGRRDGHFNAIRLRVTGNRVHMLDLKVVYGNGNTDDIPVRAEIRDGGQSGRLDLKGRDRVIDRVELIYRAQPNFKGRATICVEGLAVTASAPAPGPTWVQLGCKTVAFNVDRDVIRVGRQDGRFSAIRVRVAGNRIQLFDLKVVYGNGNPDDLSVRATIPAGGTSGVLDLRGGSGRTIDRIEIVYASQPNFRGRAEVCIEGRAA
jgi:hypothetical protein